MTYTRNILVVANVTAVSGELVAALESRAASEPTTFTVIVPATPFGGGRDGARDRLDELIARLHAARVVVTGYVVDGGPIVAVSEAWDPRRYDEIIVSTLPMRVSKWLRGGLPVRIGELTGAPVTHVVCRPRPQIQVAHAKPRAKSTIGPLSVLAWGGRKT